MDSLAIAAVVLGTLVVFGYLVVIWWLDRYEREPFWLTLLVFAWGGFGGTSLGCLCSIPFVLGAAAVGGEAAGSVFGAVVVAPIVEEITKGLVFFGLVFTRHLDNQTDGLIYGAATGLGFAAVENISYALQFAEEGTSALIFLVFMRTFFSAIVHCISSGILGMMVGYASHRSGAARWVIWPAIGLALASLNHAVWNGLATAAEFEVIGEPSGLEVIPFWMRRRRRDWLPAHVPQERYIRAATRLALRHNQLEIARGERRERYLADIAALRGEIASMLARA